MKHFTPSEQLEDVVGDNYSIGLDIELREPTLLDITSILLSKTKSNEMNNSIAIDLTCVGSLSDDLTDKLLNRIPTPIANLSGNEECDDFFMREKSLKAPKSADTYEIAFPPEEKLEKPEQIRKEEESLLGSSLSVLRFLPEGQVDRSVPHISITF